MQSVQLDGLASPLKVSIERAFSLSCIPGRRAMLQTRFESLDLVEEKKIEHLTKLIHKLSLDKNEEKLTLSFGVKTKMGV